MSSIDTKAEYYALAARGALGNTLRQYFSLEDWRASDEYDEYALWGVRSGVTGAKCFLNCLKVDVPAAFAETRLPNVSAMVSAVVPTLWGGDVWDSPTGLTLHGLLAPPLAWDWRVQMRSNQRTWTGTAARALLRTLMTPDSYEDMNDVFDRYPGHVYEVSVFERCLGTRPGRNGVVWEVRNY